MRCKACDSQIMGPLTYTVKLETGKFINVEETLCRECRRSLFVSEDKTEDYHERESKYVSLGHGCYVTKPHEVE